MEPEEQGQGAGRQPTFVVGRADALPHVVARRADALHDAYPDRSMVAPVTRRPLDQLDQRIAAALQINPRATWRQIAAAVDTTEDTARRRAERLFATGLIRTTAITDNVVPVIRVLLQFTCGPAHAMKVAQALADRDDVRFVTLVTGPFDVVAEMVTPSNRALAYVILHELPAI